MQTLIFFLQEKKKLKVSQKLDINIVYFWSSAACLHTHLLENKNERGFVSNGKFLITPSYVATAVKFRVIKVLPHRNNFGTRRDRNPL